MDIINPFSLKEKKILVTGASSGIGRSICIECSKLGATVILTARDLNRLEDTLKEMHGENHEIVVCDINKDNELVNLVDKIPRLNGVVLCAGMAYTSPIQFNSRDKFKEIFETNFFSPIELLRLLYKKKKLEVSSSIVFIASIAGLVSFNPGNSIYGASKSALNAFMKYCVKEFAPRRIKVNSICPGMVETPMIHKGTFTEEQYNLLISRNPLKRFAKPEDIAYATAFLLSDASSYINGTSLIIDGGQTV